MNQLLNCCMKPLEVLSVVLLYLFNFHYVFEMHHASICYLMEE